MSIAKEAYYALGSLWAGFSKHVPTGRNIYDSDWDICIVLDSLRVDTLRALVAGKEDWPSINSAWSTGSVTTEWLSNTFCSPYAGKISNTTLLTANPHSQTVLADRAWLTNQSEVKMPYPSNHAVKKSDFDAVHELWRTHATTHNAVPAETMRDATIQAHRETDSRVVAHWLQPHEPFVGPDCRIVGGEPTAKNIWQDIKNGQVREDDVRQSYRANAAYALDCVDDLRSRVDADILLTADHGNAFGEWGIYGHPFGWPQPAVRKVPWVNIEATKTNDYEPEMVLESTTESTSIEKQLKALGYA